MDALMISISGMRGTIGGTLTPQVIAQMASAIAAYLKDHEKPANGRYFRVVLGRDTRPSGPWVRDAAVAALTASGVEVVDLGIATTPGVNMMIKHLQADGGIILTASHNPIQWNGVKFLDRRAAPPANAVSSAIRDYYHQQRTRFAPVQELIPPTSNSDTDALHVERVLKYVDVRAIAARRFKVVLDSVNGAGGASAVLLLKKLGCEVVQINGEPNGQFAHEPEPTEANLRGLTGEILRHNAAIGFAQDPDADRLALVDEKGVYIGEEYTTVLAARLVLAQHPGVAVTNLASSRMLDDVAAEAASRVVRTPVGEANVVEAMLQLNAVIGGEGNGGVIDPRIVCGRDSITGIAYILQLMASRGKTLSQLVDEIPRYQFVKTKFECRREDADKAVAALKKEFASERVDTRDGIRIDWDNAWVLARPSNTEPIMRIVAEATDTAAAETRIAQLRAIVDRELGH
jgi:phosphomannomutase